MTFEEFNQGIDRIGKFYAKNGEPQELNVYEAEEWFRELEKWSKTHFDNVIEQCFRDNQRMPKLSDILNCERTLPRHQEKREIPQFLCDKCGKVGLIKYTKAENGKLYDMFCRCDCKNAEQYINLYPAMAEVGIRVITFEKDGALYRKLINRDGRTKEELIRYFDYEQQKTMINQLKAKLMKTIRF